MAQEMMMVSRGRFIARTEDVDCRISSAFASLIRKDERRVERLEGWVAGRVEGGAAGRLEGGGLGDLRD